VTGVSAEGVLVIGPNAVLGFLDFFSELEPEAAGAFLPEDVATALRSVKHKHPAYFFWSGHSKVSAAVSVWRKRLADVFMKAKIPRGHSHRLRDTFAVSLLEAGVLLDSVSVLLGHKSIKITERHYSPWVKTRQDALDREILKVISNRAGTIWEQMR
jgi:integrase